MGLSGSKPKKSKKSKHNSAKRSKVETKSVKAKQPQPQPQPQEQSFSFKTSPGPSCKHESLSSSSFFSSSLSCSASLSSSSSSLPPCEATKPTRSQPQSQPDYKLIKDNFKTYSELEVGLRKAGLETSQLIIGIDFTRSNTEKGGPPYFNHDNLHELDVQHPNPYQQVLKIMCKSLAPFDEDQYIDAYGFGDSKTRNKRVFSLQTNPLDGNVDQPCYKLEGVLERYTEIVPHLTFSGPTSFAPIIRKAIELVKDRDEYHILLIIADGAVNDKQNTIDAIVEASKHALSIVCIGVGQGPWDIMEEFDDEIPERDFDNFQFVDFYKVMQECKHDDSQETKEVQFAKHALMEIPDQYTYISQNILK